MGIGLFRQPDMLPHYNTFTKMRSDSPTLLKDTWLLRVVDLRGLSVSANRLGTHTVDSAPPTANVHSEPIEAKIVNASEMLHGIFSDGKNALKSILLSHTMIRDWLTRIVEEADSNRRAVGQRLRGFSTFCIA